jgi:hypothetical protein
MIKPLRKRHLQVWTLFAFLIPAGIISAYIVVPEEAFSKLLQEDKTAALPVVINKAERKNYSLYLRSSTDKKKYQLQCVNAKESTLPSALIYQLNNGEKELIGRIESTGSYYFSLKADTTNWYNFILHDIIHQQTIDTINFKQ